MRNEKRTYDADEIQGMACGLFLDPGNDGDDDLHTIHEESEIIDARD